MMVKKPPAVYFTDNNPQNAIIISTHPEPKRARKGEKPLLRPYLQQHADLTHQTKPPSDYQSLMALTKVLPSQLPLSDNVGMKSRANPYKRRRFPPEIIQYTVWLHYRFNLSHRDIEDMLAERGMIVTRESVRLWCNKFGPQYALRLRRKHRGFGDTFFIDEVFVKIEGKQYYLWRAVDQDGEVVDVFLQSPRDGVAVKRFFKRLIKSNR